MFDTDEPGSGYTYVAVAILVFIVIYIYVQWDTQDQYDGPVILMDSEGMEVIDEPAVGEEVTLGDVVVKKNGEKALKASEEEDPGGKDKVVKQKSDVDGEYYYV